MIQETQERRAIRRGVADGVAGDHDIESRLLLREAIAVANPFIYDCRPMAEVDEEAADALLIQREKDVIAVILPKQLDDRVERRLVVDESDFEQQPAPLHS